MRYTSRAVILLSLSEAPTFLQRLLLLERGVEDGQGGRGVMVEHRALVLTDAVTGVVCRRRLWEE